MADDNRPLKYMRYAIGEIVLVVIGILIALQINSMNQAKKDRVYELKMLNNIRNDLYSDIMFDEYLYGRAKNADLGCQTLLEAYGTDDDSLVLLVYPVMTMGMSYDYRKGAYEALKSTGLDRISNDTIRELLTIIYDFGKPRMYEWIRELESHKQERVEKLELELFNPELTINTDGKRDIILGLKEKDLLKDNRLLELIQIYRFRAHGEMGRLESVAEKSKLSLKVLNRELKDSYPFTERPKNEIKSIGIIGSATEGAWETDIDMHYNNQNGTYTVEIALNDGEVKFRANDTWNINWGGFTFPSGHSMSEGNNIKVKSGYYRISLNIKNEFYQFEKIDKP